MSDSDSSVKYYFEDDDKSNVFMSPKVENTTFSKEKKKKMKDKNNSQAFNITTDTQTLKCESVNKSSSVKGNIITPKDENELYIYLDYFNTIVDKVAENKEKCKILCEFTYEVVNSISSEINNYVTLYYNTGFVRYDERYKLLDNFNQHLEKYDGPNYDMLFQ